MAGESVDAKVVMEAVDRFSKVMAAYFAAMEKAEKATKEAGQAMKTLDAGPAVQKVTTAGEGIAQSQQKIGKAAEAAKGTYVDAQGRMRDASGRFLAGATSDQKRHQDSSSTWGKVVTGIYERAGHAIVETMMQAGREVMQFAKDGIQMAADFETGMKRIKSAAGSSLAEAGLTMDDVRNKALDLGQVTQFSAADAQEAFLNLVKGGVPVATAFGEATKAALDLAAAAEIELGPAAEYVAKQYAAWSKSGVTATDIADVMSQTAQASAVGADDLALGLYNVGGAAAGMGMSFEDANRGIALVVSGFSGGAEAGTGFKSMLAALTPTSKTARKAMKDLGLITKEGNSVFFDATGTYEGLEDTAGELEKAFAGLSEEQRAVYSEAIFGTYGMNAAIKLMEAGAGGVQAMTKSMTGLGSAQEQAKAKQEGFAYAMDQFTGSMDTFKIVALTPVLNLLTILLDRVLTPGANAMLALAKSFASAESPFAGIEKTVNNVISVFRNLFAMIGGDDSVSRIHGLQFALETFMPPDMAAKVAGFVSSVVTGIGQVVTWVTTNWPLIATVMGTVIASAVGFAQEYILPFVGFMIGAIGQVIGFIAANFPAILATIQSVMATVGSVIEQYVMPFAMALLGVVQQLVGWFVANLPQISAVVGAVFGAVAGFITTLIIPNVLFVLSIFQRVLSWVSANFPLMVAVADAWSQKLQAAFKIVGPALQVLGALFKVAFDLIKTVITTFVDVVLALFKAGLQLLTGDTEGALDTVRQVFSDKFEMVKTFLRNLVPQILTLGQNIITGLLNGLKSAGNQIYDYLVGLIERAVGGVKQLLGIASPSKLMGWYGEMTMVGFADGIWSMREQVADAMRGVIENAIDSAGAMMGEMAGMAMEGDLGSALGEMAADGIGGTGTGAIGGALGGAGGPTQVNVVVDGQPIARAIVRHGAAPIQSNNRRRYGSGGGGGGRGINRNQ